MEIQQVLETLSFGFEEKDWHIVFLATHEINENIVLSKIFTSRMEIERKMPGDYLDFINER